MTKQDFTMHMLDVTLYCVILPLTVTLCMITLSCWFISHLHEWEVDPWSWIHTTLMFSSLCVYLYTNFLIVLLQVLALFIQTLFRIFPVMMIWTGTMTKFFRILDLACIPTEWFGSIFLEPKSSPYFLKNCNFGSSCSSGDYINRGLFQTLVTDLFF